MKIGVFSVIEWSFLDQRPQMLSKKLAEWGHQVVYFEPFFRLSGWNEEFKHPWQEYEQKCWTVRDAYLGVKAMTMLWLPAHKSTKHILEKNHEYEFRNIKEIINQNLDLAIVVDPGWGRILDKIGIPYVYDHVDDTHQMESVLTDYWWNEQRYCEKNAIASIYIQANIARRHGGLYVPNGIDTKQLDVPHATDKYFDAGCLSAIADWFDIDSVLSSNKKILLIGPMELTVKNRYDAYRKSGKTNVTWVPRVSRQVGAHWLTRCKTALVPFDDQHPIVDYVMPLKLVEYLYLGLPSVSYLNKGIEEEFGDVVNYYSSINWRGLPDLDEAINLAMSRTVEAEKFKKFASKFNWDAVLAPFNRLIQMIDHGTKRPRDTRNRAELFIEGCDITLIKDHGKDKKISSWRQPPLGANTSENFPLPQYLDLYFELFKKEFDGENLYEKKINFLTWLVINKSPNSELSHGKVDPFVYECLDSKDKNVTQLNGYQLTAFEVTYLRTNNKSFLNWGYSCDESDLGKRLAWIYTWGYSEIESPYLEHSINRWFVDSNESLPNGFRINRLQKLLIDSHFRKDGAVEKGFTLLSEIACILFNHKRFLCPISERQLKYFLDNEEILDEILQEYARLYYHGVIPKSIDCHPKLNAQVLKIGGQ